MSTRFVGPLTYISADHDTSLEFDAAWGGPAQPSFRGWAGRNKVYEVHNTKIVYEEGRNAYTNRPGLEGGQLATWSCRKIEVRNGLCYVAVPSDRPSRLAAQVAFAARKEGLEPTGLLPGEDVSGWQEHPCLSLDGVTLSFIPYWPETGGQKTRLEVKSSFRQGSIAHRRAVEAVWPRWKEALPELPAHPAAVKGW